MANDQEKDDEARAQFNELLSTGKSSTSEAASLFYYLNRTGYNGLCRFNSKGRFNVPFGSYKTINYRTEFCISRGVQGLDVHVHGLRAART